MTSSGFKTPYDAHKFPKQEAQFRDFSLQESEESEEETFSIKTYLDSERQIAHNLGLC